MKQSLWLLLLLLSAPLPAWAGSLETIDGIPCLSRYESATYANGKIYYCHLARSIQHGSVSGAYLSCRSDRRIQFTQAGLVEYCVQQNGVVYDQRSQKPAAAPAPKPVQLGNQPKVIKIPAPK